MHVYRISGVYVLLTDTCAVKYVLFFFYYLNTALRILFLRVQWSRMSAVFIIFSVVYTALRNDWNKKFAIHSTLKVLQPAIPRGFC